MNPAENYILKQPEPFKSILLQLQMIIQSAIPELELKYKWKVPYYYYNRNPFCYLNATKKYVDLGFWASAHLEGFDEYLITEKRKVIKSLRYYSVNDIDQELLVSILKELVNVSHKGFWKD
ncbi:DUF1801 domain-containing protein [Pseudotenacibaculum sp. MALMAid0570]|uniref:DUF1801 domain-containing protein n=1 Tax=Pseudotenacibaculum sp. MALMAid0570 TaxID=3143938 RepID=UPI0032DFBEBB